MAVVTHPADADPSSYLRLAKAVQSIAAARSTEDVRSTVCNQARHILSADVVTLDLREDIAPTTAESRAWSNAANWVVTHAEALCIPDTRNDPRIDAFPDDPSAASLLVVPLPRKGLVGALTAQWVSQTQITERMVAGLEALAACAALALAAARLRDDLHDSHHRMKTTFDAARLGSWELDLATGALSASEHCKANFGRSADDEFTYEQLLQSIHPDDRERQNIAVAAAIANRAPLNVEYRAIWPDGSWHWIEVRGQFLRRANDSNRLVGVSLDITMRKQQEEHVRLVVHEVAHRAKNLLAVAQSIANQTARSSASPREFSEAFGARLRGLASSTDLLVVNDWHGVSIHDLAKAQLALLTDCSRVDFNGPDLRLKPLAAHYLGMAFHELATNALKFGALSTGNGRISISWSIDAGGSIAIVWAERGGPTVAWASSESGFGHQVLETLAARALNGRVHLEFAPSGITWSLLADPEFTLESDA